MSKSLMLLTHFCWCGGREDRHQGHHCVNLDSNPAQSENVYCQSGAEDLYGTTEPECRNDCLCERSGVCIAANLRTARRERPSPVASVRQDPNAAVPDAHPSLMLLSPDCHRNLIATKRRNRGFATHRNRICRRRFWGCWL
jgi:hypothetical protein